jgi:Ca2+-binding RTX toxin-like protein
VKYGPFTVIDPAKATAQEAAIADAVLGSATPGLHFDAGSLAMTAGASSAMFYDGSLAPLGIGSGLLITTGTVPGTANTATWFGQDNGMPGSPLLDAVVNTVFNTQSFDATTISFDFTVTDAALTGISFKAVFGSDEFPEWVDAFVDIAVVMVNGTNVALFNNDPGAPLSVIGSNLAANYFQDNTGNLDPATGLAIPGKASLLPIEYDGVSHVLNISAPVHLGVNTITIGIADTGDHVYDSGLFISGLAGTTVPGGGVTLPVTGTDNPDVLTGTAASETIDAKGGNDTIDAGGGNDSVLAGAGDDLITGGAGNDYIDGGTGANTAVYTGLSTDYHVQHLANGNYTVEDLRNGTPDGIDTLLSVQTLNFLDGSYAVGTWDVPPPPPASTGVVINGTNGDNIISPTVTLTGEPAVTDLGDTIYGNGGDDIITGGAGNDSIFGGDGNDQLRGGGGNDTLVGDAGHDELTGGSGADVFRFLTASDATVAAPDQILDFSHSDGDHIDLSALGVFSFAFGAAAFTGQAMELISIKGTDGYLVEGDINGDGMADFAIQVSVATKLIATDFIL